MISQLKQEIKQIKVIVPLEKLDEQAESSKILYRQRFDIPLNKGIWQTGSHAANNLIVLNNGEIDNVHV